MIPDRCGVCPAPATGSVVVRDDDGRSFTMAVCAECRTMFPSEDG